MEFLKEFFGEKALTFEELVQAINAHNGNEANKENQIKVGNLGTGEYVNKGKYDSLDTNYKSKEAELIAANDLIKELQKGTKGNEELQGKITGYETQVAQLQQQLADSERHYAFEVLLMDAGVQDKDAREFLMYKYEKKLKEEGKSLELDENKHIKGGEEIVSSMKTSSPNYFKSGTNNWKPGDNRLPEGDNGPVSVTREQFLKMGYNDRLKLKQENEQLYRQFTKN